MNNHFASSVVNITVNECLVGKVEKWIQKWALVVLGPVFGISVFTAFRFFYCNTAYHTFNNILTQYRTDRKRRHLCFCGICSKHFKAFEGLLKAFHLKAFLNMNKKCFQSPDGLQNNTTALLPITALLYIKKLPRTALINKSTALPNIAWSFQYRAQLW